MSLLRRTERRVTSVGLGSGPGERSLATPATERAFLCCLHFSWLLLEARLLALAARRRVAASLGRDGLVYRYAATAEAGLPEGEGAFLMWSLWLADCYAELGRPAEAPALFERLLGYANDVGLYAEEVDPPSGAPPGHLPASVQPYRADQRGGGAR